MLETKKLDELFCLLKIMTQPLASHPETAWLLTIWRLLKGYLLGFFFLVIAYLWLPALWQRFEITSPDLHDAQLVVNCLFEIL